MRVRKLRPMTTHVLLLLVSCGADGALPGGDSPSDAVAGSEPQITEARQERRRMPTPEPILSLGAEEGSVALQFQDVRGAVRLSDGVVVVADRGTGNLRWYDANRAHLRTAGRRGEGPGEFQGLVSLFLRGDTLVAFDGRLQRVSYFSRDGEFVRSFQTPTRPGLLEGIFSDGSVLMADVLPEGAQLAEGFHRPLRDTYRIDPDGNLLQALPSFPGREEVVRTMSGAGGRTAIMAAPPVFGMTTVFAVFGDRFAVSDQSGSTIHLFGSDGTTLPAITWHGEERAVTEEVRVAYRDFVLGQADGPEARRTAERRLREEVYPDSLPAHGRILFDSQGLLWVESYSPPGLGPVPWRVFDRRGEHLETVLMPERFYVFEVDRDYVLGKWWDRWDVEHIRLYGLVPSSG